MIKILNIYLNDEFNIIKLLSKNFVITNLNGNE